MTTTKKVENFTKNLIATISSATPAFLIFCILTLGFFNAAMEIIHYKKVVIGSLAYVSGFVFGGIRFASGLGGVKMIMIKNYWRGLIFIAASLGSTIWINSHAESIAESIALESQVNGAIYLTRTAIWTGLIGEILLALYMSVSKRKKL